MVLCHVVHPKTSRHQTLVPANYTLPSSGLHLSLSESSSPPCLDCATHSWAQQKHTARCTPFWAVGIPLRHTGAFCCSWELCEALSGPSAWMCPMNIQDLTGHKGVRLLPPPLPHQDTVPLHWWVPRPLWVIHHSSRFPCESPPSPAHSSLFSLGAT